MRSRYENTNDGAKVFVTVMNYLFVCLSRVLGNGHHRINSFLGRKEVAGEVEDHGLLDLLPHIL